MSFEDEVVELMVEPQCSHIQVIVEDRKTFLLDQNDVALILYSNQKRMCMVLVKFLLTAHCGI